VSFLYRAKNIIIKRSKTKLEHGLPMPNLKNFESNEKKSIVDLIKSLTFLLIDNHDDDLSKKHLQNSIDKLFFKLFDLDEFELNNLLNEYYFLPLN
jgi:hypothetical protein